MAGRVTQKIWNFVLEDLSVGVGRDSPCSTSPWRVSESYPGAFDRRGPVQRGHVPPKNGKLNIDTPKMNVSFDVSLLENLTPASGLNSNNNVTSEQHGALSSLVKDKSKEHLVNAILRQAYHEGLLKTLGFPNWTLRIKTNIPVWFSSGGILAKKVLFACFVCFYLFIYYLFCFLIETPSLLFVNA
jgi:hypothetical protein